MIPADRRSGRSHFSPSLHNQHIFSHVTIISPNAASTIGFPVWLGYQYMCTLLHSTHCTNLPTPTRTHTPASTPQHAPTPLRPHPYTHSHFRTLAHTRITCRDPANILLMLNYKLEQDLEQHAPLCKAAGTPHLGSFTCTFHHILHLY